MTELVLNESDLITSKTDLKGNILYCNAAFLQFAECEEEEILFKPHNIIRHADMPKCVFKILWDHVKQGKEVFAFVKNRTLKDNYYWVFANVTANYDQNNRIIGYYSVRRKPNKKAIEVISKLYNQALQIERKSGIKASYDLIASQAASLQVSYNNLIINLQRTGNVA